jgi:hypothetical protein
VAVAPVGDIFVADGHESESANNRIGQKRSCLIRWAIRFRGCRCGTTRPEGAAAADGYICAAQVTPLGLVVQPQIDLRLRLCWAATQAESVSSPRDPSNTR